MDALIGIIGRELYEWEAESSDSDVNSILEQNLLLAKKVSEIQQSTKKPSNLTRQCGKMPCSHLSRVHSTPRLNKTTAPNVTFPERSSLSEANIGKNYSRHLASTQFPLVFSGGWVLNSAIPPSVTSKTSKIKQVHWSDRPNHATCAPNPDTDSLPYPASRQSCCILAGSTKCWISQGSCSCTCNSASLTCSPDIQGFLGVSDSILDKDTALRSLDLRTSDCQTRLYRTPSLIFSDLITGNPPQSHVSSESGAESISWTPAINKTESSCISGRHSKSTSNVLVELIRQVLYWQWIRPENKPRPPFRSPSKFTTDLLDLHKDQYGVQQPVKNGQIWWYGADKSATGPSAASGRMLKSRLRRAIIGRM